ncbi:MAG: hypothetical protein WAV30_05980 [Microgenomates group bacterium]
MNESTGDFDISTQKDSTIPELILEKELDGPELIFVYMFANAAQGSTSGNKYLETIHKPGDNLLCGVFMYGLMRELAEKNPRLKARMKEFPPYEELYGQPGPDGLNSKEVNVVFTNDDILRETNAVGLWKQIHEQYKVKPAYDPFPKPQPIHTQNK